MDAEIFSWNAAIAAGITVDDETIAADVIAEVGIGGNYLGQRHTRRHMKEVWRPRLLDRSMWDAWVAAGREGAYEKATGLARRLVDDAPGRASRAGHGRGARPHRRRGVRPIGRTRTLYNLDARLHEASCTMTVGVLGSSREGDEAP